MSLFQRAWARRPVGERMRTGPHAGKPTWLHRATSRWRKQYPLRCGKCFMWGWACTVRFAPLAGAPDLPPSRWWCHDHEDGFVEEGDDCPNCGHASSAEEMADYERKWRYDRAGRRY